MQKRFLALSLLLTVSCATAMETQEPEEEKISLHAMITKGLTISDPVFTSDPEFSALLQDFKNKLADWVIDPNDRSFDEARFRCPKSLSGFERLVENYLLERDSGKELTYLEKERAFQMIQVLLGAKDLKWPTVRSGISRSEGDKKIRKCQIKRFWALSEEGDDDVEKDLYYLLRRALERNSLGNEQRKCCSELSYLGRSENTKEDIKILKDEMIKAKGNNGFFSYINNSVRYLFPQKSRNEIIKHKYINDQPRVKKRNEFKYTMLCIRDKIDLSMDIQYLLAETITGEKLVCSTNSKTSIEYGFFSLFQSFRSSFH